MNESLQGVRIWLAGSIPVEATPEEADRIRAFLTAFAVEVFRWNGRLVHGSHPTIRDTLLQAAEKYRNATKQKAGLVLAVSRFFSKTPEQYGVDLKAWNTLCAEKVIETREALADPQSGEVSREGSLRILRDILVEQCNVILAVGGKWWSVAAARAGVPEEIELARTHHLPLFLLGGLGGSTRAYLEQRSDVLRSCRNGLADSENLALSQIANPAELANKVIEQIGRLSLRARTTQSGRPFRILSLDGGGIRGTFSAAVLNYWERATARRVVDHFDLIAGTSTGGILAIGLGLGMTAGQMLDFYVKQGGAIFPLEDGISRLTHSFRHWFGAKFDQNVLRAKLQAGYATAPVKPPLLDDSLTRLVIPAYNSAADTLIVFRTPHSSGGKNDAGRNAIDVALATAAAPTYFNPVQVGHLSAVDGGVWANSPTTVALAEATRELNVAPERVEMLSIGTTYSPSIEGQPLLLDRKFIEALIRPAAGSIAAKVLSFLWQPTRVQGKLGWLPNIANFLMKTQAQTAEHVCERILGERYLRVDEATTRTDLDDVSSINRLIALAEAIADKHLHVVKTRFLNGLPVDSWKT